MTGAIVRGDGTMKYILFLLAGLSFGVFAADITINWDADPATDTHRVYISECSAWSPWSLPQDFTTGPPVLYLGAPDVGHFDFKACGLRGSGSRERWGHCEGDGRTKGS